MLLVTEGAMDVVTLAGVVVEVAEAAVEAEEIADRKSAIIDTIAKLRKDDILLIAGKGHEDYQIIGKERFKFSDIEIARKAVQKV